MSDNNRFLNERRRAVLTAIAEGITRDGYAPSTRALVAQVGMSSTSVVAYHIHALEQAGYLIRPRDANGKAFAHTMSLTPKAKPYIQTSNADTATPHPRKPGDRD